jgi:hypothetical protein
LVNWAKTPIKIPYRKLNKKIAADLSRNMLEGLTYFDHENSVKFGKKAKKGPNFENSSRFGLISLINGPIFPKD